MSGPHAAGIRSFDPSVEEGAPLLHGEAVGRRDELHGPAHARTDTNHEATLLERFPSDRLLGRLAVFEPAAGEKDAVDRSHDRQAPVTLLNERRRSA